MKKFIKKYFLFNKENNFKPIQNSGFALGIFAMILFFSFGIKMINCYFLRQNSIIANLNTIDIVYEINKIRSSYGLEPLVINPKLNLAATLKAEDMINKNYFDHYSPEGKTPWHWFSVANYSYRYAGENLALNFWNDKETVDAWLNSPTHRENILNPKFLETGVAILSGTTSTTKESKTVIVQLFGSEIVPKNKDAVIKTVSITNTKTTTMPIVATSTTSTLKIVSQVGTTVENIPPVKPIVKNQIELAENDNPERVASTEDLQNVSLMLNDQNVLTSDSKIIGYTLTKDVVDGSFLKWIDNGFGIGLLFLGIFGIINIHNENQLAHSFKRKALLKNLAIFVVGIGLILSGYTGLFAQIKLPIF